MKLLIACPMAESARQALKSLVNEIEYAPDSNAESILANIDSVGILVVNQQRVGREILGAAKTLQMVIRAGEGVGEISVDMASEQGILVSHCPGVYDQSTAELAFGLMIALDRRLVDHTIELRENRWARGTISEYRGLAGKCLGILGYEPEGQRIAEIANAIGMDVHVWSPTAVDSANEGEITIASHPVALAESCDFVCLTPMPESDQTPVVGREFLNALPAHAIFVNVGSAHEVAEKELRQTIETKKLLVGVDTHLSTPSGNEAKFRSELFKAGQVIGTPKLSHWTSQARDAVADEVVRVIRAFLINGEPRNCVNLLEKSPATWQLVLRVRDQVGVMASILDAIRADGVNAEEITSRVFTGAKAAWCTIALDERPSRDAVATIRQLPDIMHLELRAVI
ncbi:MAG: NAD(P)-dependent oxidoreductase [Phycisphaerae bacterium]